MVLYNNSYPFKQYSNYIFSNPLFDFTTTRNELFANNLDTLGRIKTTVRIPKTNDNPGLLKANLIARVTEIGGDESITSQPIAYYPYSAYVGVNLVNREFETDKELSFPVVVVDENANANELFDRILEYKIYKLDWSWWKEGSAYEYDRYVNSKSAQIVASGIVENKEIKFRVDYPSWGRYLLLVRDEKSNHASGGEFLVDWPDWRGQANKANSSAKTMLSFSLDKQNYEVGERSDSLFAQGCWR